MPTSVVDLCLRPPSWQEWMKLLEIVRNCSCSPIIFLKSFPIVFKRTIGWKDLGKSYTALLGLGMTTVIDILKWDGQWPKSIQVLAISMNLVMYSLLLMILLIWLQVSLSRPGADELLHLSIALISSSLENGVHTLATLLGISSKSWRSTSWDWVKLKEL